MTKTAHNISSRRPCCLRRASEWRTLIARGVVRRRVARCHILWVAPLLAATLVACHPPFHSPWMELLANWAKVHNERRAREVRCEQNGDELVCELPR